MPLSSHQSTKKSRMDDEMAKQRRPHDEMNALIEHWQDRLLKLFPEQKFDKPPKEIVSRARAIFHFLRLLLDERKQERLPFGTRRKERELLFLQLKGSSRDREWLVDAIQLNPYPSRGRFRETRTKCHDH